MSPNSNVKIYSYNIDILIILIQLAPLEENILYVKCNANRGSEEVYNVHSFKHEELKPIIAFLHVFTGCDVTSCFYRQGKNKLLELMIENKDLQILAKTFCEKNATRENIAKCGKTIIEKIYAKAYHQPKVQMNSIHLELIYKYRNGLAIKKMQLIGVGNYPQVVYNQFILQMH